MPEQTQADLFPLIRGGGVFLAIVGAGILLGVLQFRWRNQILGAAAALATLATMFSAAPLAAPYGAPTAFQVGALGVAVALEIAALIWVARRFGPRGQRDLTLAALCVVGAHFLLMAPAFGPLVIVLGALSVANALAGVRFASYALAALWAVDGLLKLGFGLAMFCGQLLPCFWCGPA